MDFKLFSRNGKFVYSRTVGKLLRGSESLACVGKYTCGEKNIQAGTFSDGIKMMNILSACNIYYITQGIRNLSTGRDCKTSSDRYPSHSSIASLKNLTNFFINESLFSSFMSRSFSLQKIFVILRK